MLAVRPLIIAAAGVAAIAGLSSIGPASAGAAGPARALEAHRAVYDLKLLRDSGKRGLSAVRGRILYDFSGNACDGYVLQFRQVSELDNGEGKVTVSDLRSSTWEEGTGKGYRFSSQNYLNQKVSEAVEGRAERSGGKVAVALTRPKATTFNLEAAVVFPTEQMVRLLEAARAGETLLELPVYDGSENGERVYSTLSVIGRAIEPDGQPLADATDGQPALAGLKRWPVTISYFDRAAKGGGEQTPVYSLSFQIYENGVSRALTLDYGDFALAGVMSQLEMKRAQSCP